MASLRMIVIADASKKVLTLGKFPLPVEVVRFGVRSTRDMIEELAAGAGCFGAIKQRVGQDGQPFVTDSKQGADDIIGRETVRNASPDGCTFIVGTASSHGINTAVYAKLPYGPVRDFVPVLLTNKAPNVCVVNPRIQAAPSVEFVALAKQEPSRCRSTTRLKQTAAAGR